MAFSPDEGILSGGADGAVRVHLCTVCGPVEHLLEMARDRITRALTPAERERFLHEPSR